MAETPTGTQAETPAEPATVWVCLYDHTEYSPGPGRVCPECGSPDHTGKTALPDEPGQQPEPEVKPRVTRKHKTKAT